MVVVSLLFLNVMLASDLRSLSLKVHLFFMFLMCCLNVIDMRYANSEILGVFVCGIDVQKCCLLLFVKCCCVLPSSW